MKKLFVTLTLILSLCGTNLSMGAERYALLKVNATTTTATLALAANQVAEIITLWSAKQILVTGTTYAYSLNWTVGSDAYSIPSYGSSGSMSKPAIPTASSTGTSAGYKPFFICGPSTITLKGFAETPSGTVVPNFCVVRILPTPNIMGIKQ